ncbi:DUF4062 domain-containing protein [Oscillibacter sp.]|uniref:DUF4062 domain-containing protein n=1 Tax=Oscillibacter sp. TaxID=1945593 RepID=UPI0028A05D9C|nr:DUF4062 domain-containing protein [Oscillibacter sp.]
MNKGKIFISSTVSDFEDLRSALKYWLSEMGYEVYTSETSDFPKDSSESSYQTCLSTIEKCDWYILLIGSRYGNTFRDPHTGQIISITQGEYRTAYKLFKEGKVKKIIPFVRKKVWVAKEERINIVNGLSSDVAIVEAKKVSSPNADMPVEIFSFLDEVSRASEMTKAHGGEIPYPRGNWINVFNGFSDIVETLRIELNLSTKLSELIYAANLTEEIKHNLKKLIVKNSQGYYGMFGRVTPIRDKCIEQLQANNKTSVSLTATECQVISGTFISSMTLKNNFIKECQLSGIFLDYDSGANRYKQSEISRNLILLGEAIELINANAQSKFFLDAHSCFMDLFQQYRGSPKEQILIEYTKIAPILVEHDQLSNIVTLSIAILSQLYSGEKTQVPNLYPSRLYDNFEVSPESKKELFASYDEFYGKELSDLEIDEFVAKLEGEQP